MQIIVQYIYYGDTFYSKKYVSKILEFKINDFELYFFVKSQWYNNPGNTVSEKEK